MLAIATRVSVSARALCSEWAEEFAPEREYYTLAERKAKWARREEEEARWAEQRARWEEQLPRLRAWLNDPANYDDVNYSDIFKDVYGFRPRW